MKITFLTVIVFSMVLLLSATVWEGVAEADSTGDVPGNYNVATNSFPRNTVVNITNLENGKMVRVKVVSGLEQTGLLAMLSRTAAESIDLRGNFSARIRMTQPPDDIAFSLFNLGPIDRADAPVAKADENVGMFAETHTAEYAGASPETNTVQEFAAATNGDAITGTGNTATIAESFDTSAEGRVIASDTLPYNSPYNQPYNSPYNAAENLLSPLVAPILETPAVTAGYYGDAGVMYGTLTLVPSEERIPNSAGYIIAPEDIIPSIGAAIAAQPESPFVTPVAAAVQPESPYIPPMATVPVQPEVEYAYPVEFSPFQAPLISRLEPNKWYVQVGTYGRAEYVEDEISRIGTSYPLAVQNVGTDTNPVFRILLGPFNQGESGATLQRFKSLGYADAFVRHN